MTVEAYCSTTSLFPGETLRFHARCSEAVPVTIEILRHPSDVVVHSMSAPASPQPVPPEAHARGCGWPSIASLVIPVSWRSGTYRANLTAATGDSTEIYFVVKATEATSPILMSLAVTTYEAYNSWPASSWPGNSLYISDSPARSREVSFDRPNNRAAAFFARWEGPFIRWAEDEGIELDYCTSIDLHNAPELLHRYRLLLSVGHDEYWSKEMRDNVEEFVSRGGNAAFFSGNVCMWQVRLEDGDRRLVCYRNPLEDPLTGIDNDRVTTEWYIAPVSRPTNTLTGVSFRNGAMYTHGSRYVGDTAPTPRREDAAYRVTFPEHWVFAGVQLDDDGTFGRGENILGYETDAAEYVEVDGVPRPTGRDGTPESFVILATADLTGWHGAGLGGYATMGLFRRNGTTFTAATTDWPAGLSRARSAVPQITRNVIRRLMRRRPTDEWDLIGEAPGLTSMATFERRLFGVGAGRLWRRDATPQNVRWVDVGGAAGFDALGSTELWGGRLVGARDSSLCWCHAAVAGTAGTDRRDPTGWHHFATAPAGLRDLAGANRALFAVADAELWTRTSALTESPWARIDEAEGIVALESCLGYGDMLFALTTDGQISWRPAETAGPAPWKAIGRAPENACTIGMVNGRLVVATSTRQLWWRSLG